jgi:hypothetical protein
MVWPAKTALCIIRVPGRRRGYIEDEREDPEISPADGVMPEIQAAPQAEASLEAAARPEDISPEQRMESLDPAVRYEYRIDPGIVLLHRLLQSSTGRHCSFGWFQRAPHITLCLNIGQGNPWRPRSGTRPSTAVT